MNKLKWLVTCMPVAFAAAGFAPAAFAQSDSAAPAAGASSEPTAALEDIIVTAQRRAEPLQSVPVAVSAFSANALRNANIGSLAGLQGLVPGLTIARSGATPSTPQLSLRGISLQDVEKGAEYGVGFNLDGVPLGVQTGALLDAFDIERIEVLRGPQGLLFGKNTTGGTINVIRTRPNPDADTTGRVRFTVGSFGQTNFDGVVMAPVIPGKLAAKFAMSVQKNNGEYRNSVYGGRDGDRDFRDYVFALNATPTDRLSMLLTLERLEDHSEIPPYVPLPVADIIPLGIPGYFGGNNAPCTNPALLAACRTPFSKSRNDTETQPPALPAYFNLNALTFEPAYEFDNFKLVGILGYRQSKEYHISDFDGTRFALFRDARAEQYKQFSQEIRAETNFDGPFNFVAGAFYFYGKSHVEQRASVDLAGVAPVPPGGTFINSASSYDSYITSRSYALFFQGSYEVTDQLKVTLGARYTWDRKAIDYTNYDPVIGPIRDNTLAGPVSTHAEKSARFRKATPRIGLDYQATQDLLFYASYSRGYNSGGFTGRAASAALVGPFQPETMDAYEVGFKSEWFDKRLRFNLSAFYNNLDNKQEDVLTFVGSQTGNVTLNAAKARYKGVEVEIGVVPVRGWTISGSAGYLDAEYVRYFGNLGQGEADLSGLKLRRTPKWTAGLISDFVVDAGPGRAGFNASLQYVDRYETNVLNDPRGSIPATTRIDLAARYELPIRGNLSFEIAGFVKNVTDNTTYTGTTSGNSVGTFVEFAIPTVGRTYGASLTAKF